MLWFQSYLICSVMQSEVASFIMCRSFSDWESVFIYWPSYIHIHHCFFEIRWCNSVLCFELIFLHVIYFVGFTRAKLVQNGTTSFLATVVFSDHPLGSKMHSLLKILDSQVGCIDGEGAVLEGIHCEVGHNRSIKTIRLCFVIFVLLPHFFLFYTNREKYVCFKDKVTVSVVVKCSCNWSIKLVSRQPLWRKKLGQNPPGNWVILILSGQKSCTTII